MSWSKFSDVADDTTICVSTRTIFSIFAQLSRHYILQKPGLKTVIGSDLSDSCGSLKLDVCNLTYVIHEATCFLWAFIEVKSQPSHNFKAVQLWYY